MLPILNRFNKEPYRTIIIVLVIANFTAVCFVYPGLKLFFPAFVFGYFFGKKKWDKYFDITKNNVFDLFVWLVIMGFAIGLFSMNLHFCPQKNNLFAEAFSILTGAVWGVATLFFLILLFNLFMLKIKKLRFLSWTDGVSYFIFVYNQCWGLGGTDVRQWTNVLWVQCMLFISLAIATSILMFYVNKLVNKGIDKWFERYKRKNKTQIT